MEQAKIEVVRFKKEDVIATSGAAAPYKHMMCASGIYVLVDPEGDGFTYAEAGSAVIPATYGITYFGSVAALNTVGYYFDVTPANKHIYEYSYTSSDGHWHFIECTRYNVDASGPTPVAGTHYTP